MSVLCLRHRAHARAVTIQGTWPGRKQRTGRSVLASRELRSRAELVTTRTLQPVGYVSVGPMHRRSSRVGHQIPSKNPRHVILPWRMVASARHCALRRPYLRWPHCCGSQAGAIKRPTVPAPDTSRTDRTQRIPTLNPDIDANHRDDCTRHIRRSQHERIETLEATACMPHTPRRDYTGE